MFCPNCGYEQFCPCESCSERLPPGKNPWVWISNHHIKCANCGLTADAGWWEDLDIQVFRMLDKHRKLDEARASKGYCGVEEE